MTATGLFARRLKFEIDDFVLSGIVLSLEDRDEVDSDVVLD